MPVHYLRSVRARHFKSLDDVTVQLQPLTVLVGPNGAGKSNLLSVIRFLGETARRDLHLAIQHFGGFDRICFRGTTARRRSFTIGIAATVTDLSHERAMDEYELTVTQYPNALARREEFTFKCVKGRGRRITVKGGGFSVQDSLGRGKESSLSPTSSALSTLPRLGPDEGGRQVGQLADLFASFRVFDVDVAKARRPQRIDGFDGMPMLSTDASNLATFLWALQRQHPQIARRLQQDLRQVVPGFREIKFRPVAGSSEAVEVGFSESGLPGTTSLADASFGTIRAAALLAMLHDPNPPKLTCVEEVDHGLHPHAIEIIVKRMRQATERTQLLIATHSPTFANRLDPQELVVCERDPESGASLIPAIGAEEIAEMANATDLGLGELWFTGALGGGLP